MKEFFIAVLLLDISSGVVSYRIGVGKADCTGPAAEMGYAKTSQKGCGIHLRQFSRAFLVDDGLNRVVFVSVDAGMMAHGVHEEVLSRLSHLYNQTYTQSNLILSGTHTHGAPGGFLMDFMYDLPCMGFVKESFDALVDGITRSVIRAHENVMDGRIFLASGQIFGANINRSPSSYLLNPKDERDKYPHNVDKNLVQLQFKTLNNTLIGAINWFAVHPTSMNFSNCLITSDNVGYASILLEKDQKSNFIGSFASTNLGDVSPNTKGPRCMDTGEECSLEQSTCRGESRFCVAAGPGENMFESTKIIAGKLFSEANRLLSANVEEVTGPVKHIHQYVDMPKEKTIIMMENGTEHEVRGCLPAMGYSFAAGTTDGIGEFGFKQGTRSSNSNWNRLRDLLFEPTQEDIDCHYPKPILINSGRISTPYQWQPTIVSTQILQIGSVFLVAVPGEFTTMSGRRLRKTVTETVKNLGGDSNAKAVITGLSNVYSSYITTPEEYQMQRYEGASTIFGPHTLTLYLNIYKKLATALVTGEKLASGPTPPNLAPKVMSLVPGVMFDTSGFLHQFGDCLRHPPTTVQRGSSVIAKFVSGHPRNNVMHEKTFLAVERSEKERWKVVATDADWETKFIWERTSNLIGGSEAIIHWDIPAEAEPGLYRIRHFGHYKSILGGIYPYTGTCNSFNVTV